MLQRTWGEAISQVFIMPRQGDWDSCLNKKEKKNPYQPQEPIG